MIPRLELYRPSGNERSKYHGDGSIGALSCTRCRIELAEAEKSREANMAGPALAYAYHYPHASTLEGTPTSANLRLATWSARGSPHPRGHLGPPTFSGTRNVGGPPTPSLPYLRCIESIRVLSASPNGLFSRCACGDSVLGIRMALTARRNGTCPCSVVRRASSRETT